MFLQMKLQINQAQSYTGMSGFFRVFERIHFHEVV